MLHGPNCDLHCLDVVAIQQLWEHPLFNIRGLMQQSQTVININKNKHSTKHNKMLVPPVLRWCREEALHPQ